MASLAEIVQLKRAAEQVSQRFADIPAERPGNPRFRFQVPKANLFPKQLLLVTVRVKWRDRSRHRRLRTPRAPAPESLWLPL